MSDYYRTAIDRNGRTWVETEPDEFDYVSEFGCHTRTLFELEREHGPLNVCDGVGCAMPSKHHSKPEPKTDVEDLPIWIKDEDGDFWDVYDALYKLRGEPHSTGQRYEDVRRLFGIAEESLIASTPMDGADPFGPEDAYDHVSDMCERLTTQVHSLTEARDLWRDKARDQAQKKRAANDGILKARSVIVRVRDAVGLPGYASDDDIVSAVEASNLARLRRELWEVNARANRAERDLAARALVEPDQEQANQISYLESRAEKAEADLRSERSRGDSLKRELEAVRANRDEETETATRLSQRLQRATKRIDELEAALERIGVLASEAGHPKKLDLFD